jgi:purine-binding chemotaxis protein CheW
LCGGREIREISKPKEAKGSPPRTKRPQKKCEAKYPLRREEDMKASENQRDATTRSVGKEGKYLTFFLNEEEYGISILKVREIIGMMPVTSVPLAPEFIKGVINLRGKVIPIVDLRRKFGMPDAEYTDRTCIIVVEIKGTSSQIPMGIVVDSVSEVLNIRASDIEETPSFGGALKAEYILGIGKMDGGIKILLDIDKVLNSDEIVALQRAA